MHEVYIRRAKMSEAPRTTRRIVQFCVTSFARSHKIEKDTVFWVSFSVELMTRFELVTPSLPRTCSTD